MKKIACIGEVMVELSPAGSNTFRIDVAGDTYNTAVYLRRALPGSHAEIGYVTALGRDEMSEWILASLEKENLSTRHIELRSGKTPGLYMIDVDSTGERTFSYWRSDSAARTLFLYPAAVLPETLEEYDIVYASGITLAILAEEARERFFDWIESFREAGGLFAFDSNYRPRLWQNVHVAARDTMIAWSLCDIALPSLDDELLLFGDPGEAAVVERLRYAGVKYGALKRGKRGPLALDGSNLGINVLPVTEVVDTTAAGDSFNAGFLASYCRGHHLGACMRAGHELSVTVIRHPGAIIQMTVGRLVN